MYNISQLLYSLSCHSTYCTKIIQYYSMQGSWISNCAQLLLQGSWDKLIFNYRANIYRFIGQKRSIIQWDRNQELNTIQWVTRRMFTSFRASMLAQQRMLRLSTRSAISKHGRYLVHTLSLECHRLCSLCYVHIIHVYI